jgi:hypothetical protein
VAPRWADTATPPTRASTAKTIVGAHQVRRARRPAQAKSTPQSTKITKSRNVLSWWPRIRIARSTRLPGVNRMTCSATATRGASRMVITMATK